MRTCGFCGHTITDTERSITVYWSGKTYCEICTEKIEALTPTDEELLEIEEENY